MVELFVPQTIPENVPDPVLPEPPPINELVAVVTLPEPQTTPDCAPEDLFDNPETTHALLLVVIEFKLPLPINDVFAFVIILVFPEQTEEFVDPVTPFREPHKIADTSLEVITFDAPVNIPDLADCAT